ncbi:MAG: glycoside hydrolase family 3 C-terminal domain-containing protein [Bacteroidota bacterium]
MRSPRPRASRLLGWVALVAGCAAPGHRGGGSVGGGGGFDRAIFGDANADPARRAAALVARLTLLEKVAQLENAAPAVPRLGIPAYDWWSESLHGVARNGEATVFPQAIALAATFDEDLLRRIGEAIAREARAKFEAAGARWDGSGRYQGLTFFAPNVNIFRDPRWGRGQETYGEDPWLTARLAVATVRGMQGDDPRHLRVAAVGKHFAVHSGPEADRHRFDARVDARDLADTYLPQFEALVREARVSGIMAAYNRVNGEPCVASRTLLGETLRGRWGFQGFVVGDCGAVGDLVGGHRLAADDMHAAALALRAGTDLDCGSAYRSLAAAVRAGLVTEAAIDRALARLFEVRLRLGLFDPPAGRGEPALSPALSEVGLPADAHLALAREAAQKSLVLLQNTGALPVRAGVRRIAVIGPTADDREVLLGNYHGEPRSAVTLWSGIAAAARARGIAVTHARGVSLAGRSLAGLPEALATARAADLVVAVLGLSPRLEGEEGDPDGDNPAGDRRDLDLPGAQPALLRALLGLGKPTVVVLTGGSALALPRTARPPDAVLMAWYPGEQGGHAVADVLFGDVAPSGRLPITFYRSVDDLPPFADYRMVGRTYRYFEGKPLYPFGHGLGYAAVATEGARVTATASAGSSSGVLQVALVNRGARVADEVVQVYAAARARGPGDPLRALIAFRRVTVAAGATVSVDVELPERAFRRVDVRGISQPGGGVWDLFVGGAHATLEIPEPTPGAP